MGASFESILIRTEDSDAVQAALNRIPNKVVCKFWLGPPIKGWVSLFADDQLRRDPLLSHLAKQLGADIFYFTVHDDDTFNYRFYRNGQLIDEYVSCPDYFGDDVEAGECPGNPELYQDLLPNPKDIGKLKDILSAEKDRYTYLESARMNAFVRLLGIWNAFASYDHLQEGEFRDEMEDWEKFVHLEKQPDPQAGDLREEMEDWEKPVSHRKTARPRRRFQRNGKSKAQDGRPRRRTSGLQ